MNNTTNTKIHMLLCRYVLILPLFALACLLMPSQGHAGEITMSGTYAFTGAKNITKGDVYFVDSSSNSQLSTFLVSKPNKDFWVYGLVPNYPGAADYFLIYKAYLYTYTPDRPSWLASEIKTWAEPVQIISTSGTGAPGNFRLQGTHNELSILSSDAYDADKKRRMDTDNINWSILNFNGAYSANPFIHIESMSVNNITLDLEHVIFVGAKSTNQGGTNSGGSIIRNNIGTTRMLTIKGDVGFVNNMGNHGGVINSFGSITFEGSVFFDGNIGGIVAPNIGLRDEKGLFTDQIGTPGFVYPEYTFTRNDAAAGSIRLNGGNNLSLTFKQTALFTNNVGGGEGGNLLLGGGTSQGYKLLFEGNAAFYGNIAGFIGKSTAAGGSGGPGRGGAICMLLTTSVPSEVTFKKEAIFISNRASDGGGAVSNLQSAGSNVTFTFDNRAIFTDNIGGRENRFEKVIAVTTIDVVDQLGVIAPLPNYNGNGGAIGSLGNAETSRMIFNGDSQFARNRALGLGGAISHRGTNGGIEFHDNATITNNATGSLERTYTTSTTGAISVVQSYGGGIATSVKTYFDGSKGGQLVAEGNMAYFRASGTGADQGKPDFTGGMGGAIYSDGSVGGLYIDQEYSFIRNQAGGNGGAIVALGLSSGTNFAGTVRNYSLEITKAGRFVENVASGTGANGGAIYASSALITSGAIFENNAAGYAGGAIYMAAPSGTFGYGTRLTLKAETDDITFIGNRSHVTTDESAVDLTLVTSETSTGGRITVDAGSGRINDITFGLSSTYATVKTGTFELIASEGKKIYFNGGITQLQSASDDTLLQVTKSGAGTVEFDNANAVMNAVTTIEEGTLRMRNGVFGFSSTAAGTTFELKSNATLEASGGVAAETINIHSGATLRALEGGTLQFDSANAITYGTSINLAGNGTIRTGATGQLTATSINVGDIGHTSKQTLTLLNAANQGLAVALNGSTLTFGLFSGGADTVNLGSLDLGTTTNRIDLTSLANGNFTLINATSAIANASTGFDVYYKGAKLTNGNRLTVSATASGQSMKINYNATNTVATWTGNSGDTWSISDAKWTGAGISDGKYLIGDIVKFDATKSGNVSINNDIGAAGATVSNNYTFTGTGSIELSNQLWSGATNAGADGILIKDGAANTTLTIANATGIGATNKFVGINIKSGAVAVGNAAQLGTSLANVTLTGAAADEATLKITGTMSLSGKNGNQRLNIESGKVGNLIVDSSGMLVVTDNQAGAVNGGVLHIGGGATLNIIANGDVIFFGNMAANGGGAYLANSAIMNMDIASGKTVLFGNPNREAALLDPRLTKADTLGSADATAIINKNGAGTLLLNGDNSAYIGQLNINHGTAWMNSSATFGGDVTLNNAGSLFAASTVFGNITANAGTLIQVGDALSIIPQVMRVGGALTLNDATLVLDGFQGSLIYRDVYTDTVETQSLHMSGTNSLDVNFAALSSGLYRILTVTDGSFTKITGTTFESGTAVPIVEYTIPVKTVIHNTGTLIVSTTTIIDEAPVVTTSTLLTTATRFYVDNLLLTSGGQPIIGKRFNGEVEITGSNLMLDVQVQNIRSRWTGSVAAAWNSYDANWVDPVGAADDRFVAGDGVHFDSVSDGGYEANRAITVYGGGVVVGEMIVSGTGNYTFTGGKISAESVRSNLENPTTASGALEMNGTGVLTLDNDSNKFSGGIIINSGTVIGKAASLNENTILIAENTGLVYNQDTDATMVGTIYGPGIVTKSGTATLTLASMNQVIAGHYMVDAGRLVVSASNALYVAGILGIAPEANLVFSTTLHTGRLVNQGTIQRTTGTTSNSVGQMPLVGDFVAAPGSAIIFNALQNGLGVDSLLIDGNASGTTRVYLNISGTYTNEVKPGVKRDVRIIAATGVNQLQIENPLGVNFYDSGTEGVGTEYAFVQGRDGTVFLRNQSAALVDVNLPMIGASPIISDLLGQAVNNAVTERINARHETITKGLMLWTNYAHVDDHIRDGFYADTDVKSNIIQVGGEYAFSNEEDTKYGQLTAGIALTYASAKATRANHSTIDAESHTVSAYAGYRKGFFYANAIASYSPGSDYDATTTDVLDSNGSVKGDRLAASLELGGIFTIEHGGQLEPYIHAIWQQNSFDQVSRPTQYYSFNDPTASNGRGYNFSDFSTTRGIAGIRWSALFSSSEKFAIKPWGGVGVGFAPKDAYDITIGSQTVEKDIGGEYYKFSGGISLRWAAGIEVYATGQYTKGAAINNTTLLGGINYRW